MEYLSFYQNELVQAIEQKDWQAVREICKTEEHLINAYDRDDRLYDTPLLYAAFKRAPDDIMLDMIVKATLENLKYKRPVFLSTILHFLAESARVTPLRSALERTKNANVTDCYERTPLHRCLRASLNYDQHRETAMCLMMHGASISIKDEDGLIPLHEYYMNECLEYEETTRSEKKQSLEKLLVELSVPGEIQARGETAVEAFEYEMQNGKITVVNARFMFMGKEGAGKTSCVNHILGKPFNENEQSTVGIVTTTVFQTSGEDCREWNEANVDVSKQTKQMKEDAIAENIAKRLKQESKQSTLPTSTSSLMVEMQEATSVLTSNEIGNSQAPRGARGLSTNQSVRSRDTFEKKLPDRLHKMVVNKYADQRPSNVGPCEVTSIWDYAGQLKYYITHRIYLTGGASYGVVFSLLDDLNDFVKPRDSHNGKFSMTNLEMILFWMRSIFEHAVLPNVEKKTIFFNDTEISSPPISLIATHKDQLSKSEAETHIKAMYQIIFDAIKGTAYETHVDRTIYAVDNTAKMDEGIEKLKKNVSGYMKAMARTVPTKWVDFQSEVQELGKTRLRMSLEEITTVAAKCGIANEMLTTVLEYLNDTGIILYSKTNEKLKNTVITNLHMMIDFLTKIITVDTPDNINKSPTLMPMWHKLDNEGILEEELLQHLWRREIKDDASNFDVFLELMKTFRLLFELQNDDRTKNQEPNEMKAKGNQQVTRKFIVPSRMQVNKTKSLKVKKDEKQTVSIYVTPTDFLPDAVYNILVVAFLDLMEIKGRSGTLELFQNCSDFDLDDDHVVSVGAVKIDNRHALKLEVSRRTEKDENGQIVISEPHPSICIEVLNYLRHQLKTVYVTTEGIGYKLRVLCGECQPTQKPHLHDLDDCLIKKNVPCGKMSINTSRFKRLFSIDLKTEFIKETKNFQAIQSLVIDFGTRMIREFFLKTSQQTSSSVVHFLKNEKENGRFEKMEHFQGEGKMFSPDADIDTFDIEILMTLIRYCCGFTFSDDMWQQPHIIDNKELANLIRIHQYKNTKLDQNTSCRIPTKDFENEWKGIKEIFLELGVTSEEIENIRLRKGFDKTTLEEMQNFQAVMSLVVNVGTDVMRKYFLRVNKLIEKNVGQFLIKEKRNIMKGSPFPAQQKKMFIPNADINSFDISIMIKIIRYCNNFPDCFWLEPNENHGNVLTNLVRIHQYRNTKLAHSASARMPTDVFEVEWRKLTSILEGAGVPLEEIDKYKQLRLIV